MEGRNAPQNLCADIAASDGGPKFPHRIQLERSMSQRPVSGHGRSSPLMTRSDAIVAPFYWYDTCTTKQRRRVTGRVPTSPPTVGTERRMRHFVFTSTSVTRARGGSRHAPVPFLVGKRCELLGSVSWSRSNGAHREMAASRGVTLNPSQALELQVLVVTALACGK